MSKWLLAAGLVFQTVSPEVAQHARAGLAAQQQGRLPEAIAEFQKASELAPDFAPAFVNLGAAYIQNHQIEQAIVPLRKSLQLNPALLGAHQMLGYALLTQGYFEEAIPHLEQAHALDLLGTAQLKAGRLSEAVTSLQAALKVRPGDAELLYLLGRAAGLLSKSLYDALEADYPQSARAHQALGENLAALKRNSEAEKEFQQAIGIGPNSPGLHLALGQLYTSNSDWSKAEEQFRMECKLQPGNAEAAYDLGQTLLQEGKVDSARAELERAQTLRPGMPETLYLLGKAYAQAGDERRALKAWLMLLDQEKTGSLAAQTHFGLATLYRKAGDKPNAEREMEEFRKASGK